MFFDHMLKYSVLNRFDAEQEAEHVIESLLRLQYKLLIAHETGRSRFSLFN